MAIEAASEVLADDDVDLRELQRRLSGCLIRYSRWEKTRGSVEVSVEERFVSKLRNTCAVYRRLSRGSRIGEVRGGRRW